VLRGGQLIGRRRWIGEVDLEDCEVAACPDATDLGPDTEHNRLALVRDEAGNPPFNPWSYDRARRAICGQNRLRPDAGARQLPAPGPP